MPRQVAGGFRAPIVARRRVCNLFRVASHLRCHPEIANPVRSNLEPSIDRREATRGGDGFRQKVSPPPGPACLPHIATKRVLGGLFRFESDSHDLIGLVEAAYDGLPSQTFPGVAAEFRVEMRLLPRRADPWTVEPPAPRIWQEGKLLRADIDASNCAVIDPARRRARLVASEDMLLHGYHLRSELIEFAVFILAARGLGLVPLHAACVGRHGRGLLLLGGSGSGKSTLALHGLLRGLELLAEDAVFVRPGELAATGVSNYLHLRSEALDFVEDDAIRGWITRAPIIRRRSGVEKFEVDLRQEYGRPSAQRRQLRLLLGDDAGCRCHGAVLLAAAPRRHQPAVLRGKPETSPPAVRPRHSAGR